MFNSNSQQRSGFMVAVLLVFAASTLAQADIIARYHQEPFPAIRGASTDEAMFTDSGNIARGPGIMNVGDRSSHSDGNISVQNRLSGGAPVVTNDLESAISDENYVTFTVNPLVGNGEWIQLDTLEVDLRIRHHTTTGSTDHPMFIVDFVLMSCLDGFAYGDPALAAIQLETNTSAGNETTWSVDLSARQLIEETEFRIYFYDNIDKDLEDESFRTLFQATTLTGTLVPEPTTLALLGLAGLLLLKRRRV